MVGVSSGATFGTRDPSAPEFWSERFAQSFMPWDNGGVPAALERFVRDAPRAYTTLIPGCGSGYEVACLAQAGWDVVAIDFSSEAVAAARANLGPLAGLIEQADFFSYQPARQIELIYERAFFCALPPRLRPAIVARWTQLLAPGALLAGFFFFDEALKGPPFGISEGDLHALLRPHFDCIADEDVTDSLPVFAGKERWQIWRRGNADT